MPQIQIAFILVNNKKTGKKDFYVDIDHLSDAERRATADYTGEYTGIHIKRNDAFIEEIREKYGNDGFALIRKSADGVIMRREGINAELLEALKKIINNPAEFAKYPQQLATYERLKKKYASEEKVEGAEAAERDKQLSLEKGKKAHAVFILLKDSKTGKVEFYIDIDHLTEAGRLAEADRTNGTIQLYFGAEYENYLQRKYKDKGIIVFYKEAFNGQSHDYYQSNDAALNQMLLDFVKDKKKLAEKYPQQMEKYFRWVEKYGQQKLQQAKAPVEAAPAAAAAAPVQSPPPVQTTIAYQGRMTADERRKQVADIWNKRFGQGPVLKPTVQPEIKAAEKALAEPAQPAVEPSRKPVRAVPMQVTIRRGEGPDADVQPVLASKITGTIHFINSDGELKVEQLPTIESPDGNPDVAILPAIIELRKRAQQTNSVVYLKLSNDSLNQSMIYIAEYVTGPAHLVNAVDAIFDKNAPTGLASCLQQCADVIKQLPKPMAVESGAAAADALPELILKSSGSTMKSFSFSFDSTQNADGEIQEDMKIEIGGEQAALAVKRL